MLNAKRGVLRNRALASILDPLISSGTMFMVQGAVLLTVSKTAFATYSLAYSYVVMGQAVLSALFGGPLITLMSNVTDDAARSRVGLAALRFQLLIATVLAILGLTAATSLGLPAGVSALAALGMVGLSFRDALRNVLAAQLRLSAALSNAIWFAGTTGMALIVVWLSTGHVTAQGGLAALAAGALGTLSRWIYQVLRAWVPLPEDSLRRWMSMAVWSVPGATFSWLQNSFYLTLVAVNVSLDAVGEVSAARMVVMPILITASGLLRFAQVQASRGLASDGVDSVYRTAKRMALLCLATGAIGVGLCWLGASIIDPKWLPHSYPHLLPIVGAWLAFVATTTARGFFTSLFQAMGRYRELFIYGTMVLPFVLAGVATGPLILGLPGAVLPMAAGELILLVLLVVRARNLPTTAVA